MPAEGVVAEGAERPAGGRRSEINEKLQLTAELGSQVGVFRLHLFAIDDLSLIQAIDVVSEEAFELSRPLLILVPAITRHRSIPHL